MMRLDMYQQQRVFSRSCHPDQPQNPEEELYLARNGKLKNQLCKNYLQFGYCRYNDKCQFAHGVEELRQNQAINMKYRTKVCQSFLTKGFCPYGQRCNFLHKGDTQEGKVQRVYQSQRQKWKIINTNFRDIIEQSRPKSRFF